MVDAIKFYAAVNAVKTLADGGIRVYLDLPEHSTDIAYTLMECKRVGMVLDLVVTERKKDMPKADDEDDGFDFDLSGGLAPDS